MPVLMLSRKPRSSPLSAVSTRGSMPDRAEQRNETTSLSCATWALIWPAKRARDFWMLNGIFESTSGRLMTVIVIVCSRRFARPM